MEDKFNGLHYNSIATRLKEHFGTRIIKLAIDGGFTCPNRDGHVGYGGCKFCSEQGSGEFAYTRENVALQMNNQSLKWGSEHKFLAYFQSFSNTYAPVDVLRQMWEEALSHENVVGLAIATRPDCLPDDVLALLDEFNKKTYLWVELGFQTSKEETAKALNRGYENKMFEEAMQKLSALNIKTVVHLMLSLPGETKEDMIDSATYVAAFKPFGIKLHMLNVLSDSVLGKEYLNAEESQRFTLLSKDEYIRTVCDILEILPEETTIHRLTGDGPQDKIIAPSWVKDKHAILNGIQQEFARRGTHQGINCK